MGLLVIYKSVIEMYEMILNGKSEEMIEECGFGRKQDRYGWNEVGGMENGAMLAMC